MKKIITKIRNFVVYCLSGVWEDQRTTVGVRLIKTGNLAVRSFLDRGLQLKSMSLTYSTVLALVPALAMLLAIGRGFGLQDILETSLYTYFPSQSKALSAAMSFVDSYLKEASQGVFVGIGILFLLWTVISLLSYIEDAFNSIWDVKRDRSLYQKLTDYIAICLMIPILMICSSGVSIFVATTLQDNIHISILTPLINRLLETAPFLLVWMAFTLSFWLIPNIKVNIKYAAISGAVCAVAFQIVQMLFLSGQLYVSKYNAIYGTFAFLPLMLIWLQLSWLILLSGCVLTYSLQNIFTFDFLGDIGTISPNYFRKMEIIIMAVIIDRFISNATPPSVVELSTNYDIPIRIANRIIQHLQKAGLIYAVLTDDESDSREMRYTPAVDARTLTVKELLQRLDKEGNSNFIPSFEKIYAKTLSDIDSILDKAYQSAEDLLLMNIPLPEPLQKSDKDKRKATT
ncbi:MAG: YihY family inner membrane protein [Bacteroides sp.]|nr:YihY family inner membrane protein [Bacteroides sp.]